MKIIAYLFSLGFTCCVFQVSAQVPSIKDFVRQAAYDDVALSPSGRYLASAVLIKFNSEGLSVIDLVERKPIVSRSFAKNYDLKNLRWITDDRLLFEPVVKFEGFSAGKIPTGNIYGIDKNGKGLKLLFGFLGIDSEGSGGELDVQDLEQLSMAQVIDTLPNDGEHVIVSTIPMVAESLNSSAFLLNIHTGERQKLVESKRREANFVADSEGSIKLQFSVNEENGNEVHFRNDKDGDFSLIYSTDFIDGNMIPIFESQESGIYYAIHTPANGTRGLVLFNSKTAKIESTLYSNPDADLEDLLLGDLSRELLAVRYHSHYPKYFFPKSDSGLAKQYQKLTELFPGNDIEFVSSSYDTSSLIALVSSDRNPGKYYYINGTSNPEYLFDSRPWLSEYQLAEMKPFEINTRDGLLLRGFLTFPHGVPPEKLPMIVLVHGGPHGIEDKWGFNEEVQLLASRGYAVLQVNYRGSGGRGNKFQSAGYGKWGAEMQNDITDATRWAISEGFADAERICIYGARYGGYAALTGAHREPELYKCAAGYGGVYDLPLLYEEGDIAERVSGVSYIKQAVGDDIDELRSRSPVHNANKIKANIFLAHGKNDQRAPVEHAKRMRKALRKADVSVKYYVVKKEGHGFLAEKNKIKYYKRLLSFFDKNIN